MNLNPLRRPDPAQDLDAIANHTDELGQMIEREISTAARRQYPPREDVRERTPLQLIGASICRLTYSEAVTMGEAIQAMLANETKTGPENVTAAIQAWAAQWETFEQSK